ncbi:MAG: (Fe-S)-binding protein, partial [Gemmataceae bacterium]
HNGCDVWIPRGQGCCGALHYHAGLVESAQHFAANNCVAFGEKLSEIDAIINNAGGCGPVLKEYEHVASGVASAPRVLPTSAPRENTRGANATPLAGAFAAKVRDISEFLIELGPIAPRHPLNIKAAYHDACGLSHAQKIRLQPRQLLEMIPGLELVPLVETEMCCGAAGSYNLTQPEMSEQLGRRKTQHILNTEARAVFSGNVGCLLQIARYLREQQPDLWVAHPVDALWASYSGQAPMLSKCV